MTSRPFPIVQMVTETARKRVLRRPRHPFAIKHKPYAIAPFCIAPVLPGETLKEFNWQANAVTDPIRSPLLGWHLEYYWFYCKMRDLPETEADALTAMMITPNRSMTDIDDITSDLKYYHAGTAGNINYTKLCVQSIVEYWFKGQNQSAFGVLIDGLPAAEIPTGSWMDSSQTATGAAAVDFNVDLNADTTIKASEVEKAMEQYQLLRMQGLTAQSYEEFLMSYGVSLPQTEVLRPELLRYVKLWQLPANTVEPTTGVPTSAVRWVVQERADKDRFFKEPGFIVGLSCARPKVYRGNQTGSLVHTLNSVYDWLPASMRGSSQVGRKLIDNANALLTGITEDYWVDVRDLFLYGDQFVNFALTDTDMGLIAYPTAGLGYRTMTETEVDKLFSGANKKVRQDGIASFSILGEITDPTPTNDRV